MKSLKRIIAILTAGYLVLGFARIVDGQTTDPTLSKLIEQGRNAGANATMLAQLVERAENMGISDENLMEIITAAVTLAEQKLPSEAALDKALEGISKGVSNDVIASTVTTIKTSTIRASELVGSWMESQDFRQIFKQNRGSMQSTSFKSDLVLQVSRGLRNGITEETYSDLLADISEAKVMTNTDPGNVIAAVGMIPDLPATAAEEAKIARSFVIRALKSGLNPTEMQQLPFAIAQAQMRAQLPAADLINGVSGQLDMGLPVGQIFDNLSNGVFGTGPVGMKPIGFNIPKGSDSQKINLPNQTGL